MNLMQWAILWPSFFHVCDRAGTSGCSKCSEMFYQTRFLCHEPRGIAPVFPSGFLEARDTSISDISLLRQM